jgi:type IV pilus assembly protein PilC
MISVGEETGSLDNILEQLAIFYEEEVDQTMNNLTATLEPILMLLLGLGVGSIAVAVIMPMYSLTQAF